MSAPTTLLGFYHAREVAGYCPVGVQGTVLGIVGNMSKPKVDLTIPKTKTKTKTKNQKNQQFGSVRFGLGRFFIFRCKCAQPRVEGRGKQMEKRLVVEEHTGMLVI